MFINNGIFKFREHEFEVSGTEEQLIELARAIREDGKLENTLTDLAYQIEYFFNVDGLAEVE
jgi:hypothetical protein